MSDYKPINKPPMSDGAKVQITMWVVIGICFLGSVHGCVQCTKMNYDSKVIQSGK